MMYADDCLIVFKISITLLQVVLKTVPLAKEKVNSVVKSLM